MPTLQSPYATVLLFFRGKVIAKNERLKTTCANKGGFIV